MHSLAHILKNLRNPDYSRNFAIDFNRPIVNAEQLKALDELQSYSSNEMETRPMNIQLMAKLFRAGLHYEDDPLEKNEVECFAIWLQEEMDLLSEIQYINAQANFGIEQHFKHGGKDYLKDSENESKQSDP
ncbi:hypothetical protein [Thiomicrorhabdus xiamenensis]|uniref:Uncharacterized protein n=1 Tax=Thiomicrorhabdus xiamenensis TaxID=2739063 RepID=A0A7D4P4X0_9GAMM|nr:hypothetical protein [Thiomicrorhabdus xiamenensis]QKI89215.1 hypothetical protein HQN79_06380 [Thiomicrorhabdus xiamenensis]